MAWRTSVLPGSKNRRRDTRVAREPERPCRLRRDCRLGVPAYQLQVDPQLCPELVGTNRGRTMVSPSEGNEVRRDERQGVGAFHSNVEAGELDRRTPRRERSEANCLTSGCKSRRRRSPCGAVVISGSLRGDSWAGSPDVQAPGGQVGLEPPWSGQHRGQAIRRAVAKANGLNAEMGPRTKLIQAEYWRCQEFLLSTRWPVPMRKDGAVPVSDLPAEVEGGNPGEPSSKSSEGLESRQEDP